MENSSWQEDTSKYFLLLLAVTCGLSNLQSVTCNMCNTKSIIPLIEISSSPPNYTVPIGGAVTLTCIARPRDIDNSYGRRWTKYIQWYDHQNKSVGSKCLQGTPKVLKLSCQLKLDKFSFKKSGNYTCEAGNDYDGHCRRETVEISTLDTTPEIVEDPMNQSAVIGSDVTFNCTASCYPKPNITWIRNDSGYAVQSNPRVKVIRVPLDDDAIQSQLSITELTSGDYGKYQCVANNRAGQKTSKVAFLYNEISAFSFKCYHCMSKASDTSADQEYTTEQCLKDQRVFNCFNPTIDPSELTCIWLHKKRENGEEYEMRACVNKSWCEMTKKACEDKVKLKELKIKECTATCCVSDGDTPCNGGATLTVTSNGDTSSNSSSIGVSDGNTPSNSVLTIFIMTTTTTIMMFPVLYTLMLY